MIRKSLLVILWLTLLFGVAYGAGNDVDAGPAPPLPVPAATPIASSFSTAVPANRQSSITLLGSDADGTPLVYATVSGPSHGTLTGLNTATGIVVYTPVTDYTGADSFTYTVTSGAQTSSAGTVTLTVTNQKTRIIDFVTDPSGAARRGIVTFILTQQVTTPSGISPAGATVSAKLNANGQFDIQVYPSRSMSPEVYYQVWFADATTLNRELVGIYDIPLSTTTISLTPYKVTDTNLAARYTFGSTAAMNALANAANLTALNADNLSSGTIPDARFPATLPAKSGVNLTNLNASNLASGTVPDARFPATLPAASGANLTALNGSNVSSGTVADARLSSNIPKKDAANTYSGLNIFTNPRFMTGTGIGFRIEDTGTGEGITVGLPSGLDGYKLVLPENNGSTGNCIKVTSTGSTVASLFFDPCDATAGVSSISGTANQVNVDASSGAVTVALPDEVHIVDKLGIRTNTPGYTFQVNGPGIAVDPQFLFAGNSVNSSNANYKGMVVAWGNPVPGGVEAGASFQLRQNIVPFSGSGNRFVALHTSIENLNGRDELWGANFNAQQVVGGTNGNVRGLEINAQGLQSTGTDPFGATYRTNGIEIAGIDYGGLTAYMASYMGTWHPRTDGNGWPYQALYISRAKNWGTVYEKRADDGISPFADGIIYFKAPSPYGIKSAAVALNNGIDFSASTISGDAFKSPGFRVSGTGLVESTAGGFKFPDGTTQTTAAGSGTGDLLATNNLNDVSTPATAFANIKQAATTGATGVVQVSITPGGTATAIETGDPRVSTATGVRSVYTQQLSGATLGAKISAAETAISGVAGEIVVDVDGTQAVNQQITFSEGRAIRLRGKGTITSTNSGAGNPYFVLKNGSSLICDSDAITLQVPSGSSNYEIIRTYSANTDNNDRTTGVRISGCKFDGLQRTADGAQSLIDLGNLVGGKVTDNYFVNADSIGIQIGGASNGMTARTITTIASTGDGPASLITTSVAHGFLPGDRVRIAGVTTPVELNSSQRFTDGVSNSTTTFTSASASFSAARHTGQRVQLFKSSPSVNMMSMIVSVTNSTTVVLADAIPVNTTGITADVVFANGASWVVHTVPSSTTFTVEYAPTSTGTCSGTCTGTATLLNEARDIEISGNRFEKGGGVDAAPVNAKRVIITKNFFGSRGQCTSGANVDIEPNSFTDASEQISIFGNIFDPRGTQCGVATAFSGIAMGGGFGIPEHILVDSNQFHGSTIAPGDYGASPSGGAQSNSWQLQDGIYLWQGRDITITNNLIAGYNNIGVETAGQTQTERIKISNNHFVAAQGVATRLLNTRYSVVHDNSYEWRNWLGNASYNVGQPSGSMTESSGSGFNIYRNNTGITTYTLDASSFLVSGGAGADVASASSITPTGTAFTITGTSTVSTIVATGVGVTKGTTLQMITTSAVTFDEAGNINVTGGTSLTTGAGDLVIATWDGTKWRLR